MSETRSTQTLLREPKKKGGGGVYRVSSHNRIRMQSNQNQTQSPKERKMKKERVLKSVLLPPP